MAAKGIGVADAEGGGPPFAWASRELLCSSCDKTANRDVEARVAGTCCVLRITPSVVGAPVPPKSDHFRSGLADAAGVVRMSCKRLMSTVAHGSSCPSLNRIE